MAYDKMELMMSVIRTQNSRMEAVNPDHEFDELYECSRKIGLIKPIGWLMGFHSYLAPQRMGTLNNPFPYFSLAYHHYIQGRMSAHDLCTWYYNISCP